MIDDERTLRRTEVTLISHRPVSSDAVYEAYLAALEVRGWTLSTSGGISRLVKSTDAARSPLPIRKGTTPATSQVVTQLVPLENLAVADINAVIQALVSKEANVIAYQPSNTLILTDVGHNVRKVRELLAELDVAAPKSTLDFVPLRFADVDEVKAILEELYGTETAAPAPTPRSRRARRRARRRRPPPKDPSLAGEKAKVIDKLLTDERTNTLLVLADEAGHKAVRALVEQLDIDPAGAVDTRIYAIPLEHALAADLETLLNTLSQESSQPAPRRPAPRRGRAPVPTPEEDQGGALSALDGDLRIAADEATNSLILIAKPADYKVVLGLIEQLDIKRRQVFLDATVIEISGEATQDLGLAAHVPLQPSNQTLGFAGAGLGASSLGLTTDALTGLAVGIFGPSVSIPVSGTDALQIPAFGIALNALRTNSGVDIVSNPTLLTLDNEEASIVVGRKVPFPTQVSGLGAAGGFPLQSFTREDVAFTLKVTPRVNSADRVTLEVEVEVEEIEEDDSNLVAGGGPVTSQRQVKTSILVGDNQTAVLGGLLSATDNQVETKLPLLGDLPLVGALFRSSRTVDRRTNLLVFLTPHIVDGPEDLIEIQQVKEAQRQVFLRRFYGRSRGRQADELKRLMKASINRIDEPGVWRGPRTIPSDYD